MAKKKKEVTIDDLAVMIRKGFNATEKRFDAIDKRFEQVDKHFDRIEISSLQTIKEE